MSTARRLHRGARFAGRTVAEALRPLLRKAGFRLIPAAPLDFRGVTRDPVEGFYRSGGHPFLLDVPIERCRVRASACDKNADNPFVSTLLAYGAGQCSSFSDSPLKDFYSTWQPRTLAEAVGIDPRQASPALQEPARDTPPLPWIGQTTKGMRSSRMEKKGFRAARGEARPGGWHVEGILHYGPVSEAFGEITFVRLRTIYDSIEKHGYQPADASSHMRAALLVRGFEHRVLISGGKHRIAALAALGYTWVPVQLGGRVHGRSVIVNRCDAPSWPGVRSGLFTVEQARQVFDRMFAGCPPPACRWPSVPS